MKYKIEACFTEHMLDSDKYTVGKFVSEAADIQELCDKLGGVINAIYPDLEQEITHGKRQLVWLQVNREETV